MTYDVLDIIQAVRSLTRQTKSNNDQAALQQLCHGAMDLEGLMPWSSNYTFLVRLTHADLPDDTLAIYKPSEGERPLWDFPGRSLHKREFLCYLFSQLLGWPQIPATVLREGPHGEGSVQLFIEADYEAHYFTMRDDNELDDTFRAVALFDLICNNADRKAGHCLQGQDGQIWAIDHGLTFHIEHKLRTVIHEVCEEEIPAQLLEDVAHLETLLCSGSELNEISANFISLKEIDALRKRVQRLLSRGRYPRLNPYNVPYPPI